MEGYFSKGQSPQWAVVPLEQEEECEMFREYLHICLNPIIKHYYQFIVISRLNTGLILCIAACYYL